MKNIPNKLNLSNFCEFLNFPHQYNYNSTILVKFKRPIFIISIILFSLSVSFCFRYQYHFVSLSVSFCFRYQYHFVSLSVSFCFCYQYHFAFVICIIFQQSPTLAPLQFAQSLLVLSLMLVLSLSLVLHD